MTIGTAKKKKKINGISQKKKKKRKKSEMCCIGSNETLLYINHNRISFTKNKQKSYSKGFLFFLQTKATDQTDTVIFINRISININKSSFIFHKWSLHFLHQVCLNVITILTLLSIRLS